MFLTGFADEAGSSLDIQIKATKELGWKYIETRNIDGKNLSTLTDAEFDTQEECQEWFDDCSLRGREQLSLL